MEKKYTKRKKPKLNDFKPSQDLINKKVAEFLRNGGKITRIENADIEPTEFPNRSYTDDFLMGN